MGDGIVLPEEFQAKVQIPSQQALIHFSDGIEHLVIETSFLGSGTNFAWIVPLPSVPEVRPVPTTFFTGLQQQFRPALVHRVRAYWAGVLLVIGFGVLGWRGLKQESSWPADLPLGGTLTVIAGVLGGHWFFAILAAALVLCMRLFARSPAVFALILLLGTVFAGSLTFLSTAQEWSSHLINTMGPEATGQEFVPVMGVNVITAQNAGVFDSATIQGTNASGVLEWLRRNGYATPDEAKPAFESYIREGWVFVAAKARREQADVQISALHPLAFTFKTGSAIYPTRLTAVENKACTVDLFVFGSRRARARHFAVTRCERVSTNPATAGRYPAAGLQVSDPELSTLIGNSSVATKLTGQLSPSDMASDVKIKSTFFLRGGAVVYSRRGALMIALNIALPLAALGWVLLEACRGGWGITDRWVRLWRKRIALLVLALGCGVFVFLPKVEIEPVNQPALSHANDD